MTRIALVAVFGFALVQVAQPADAPKNTVPAQPAPAKAAAVYVKIVWPVDPATLVVDKDRPGIESWIVKSVDGVRKADLAAVTGWVLLEEKRGEATSVWDGKLDESIIACRVSAHLSERKDGKIKIVLSGWGPDGSEVTMVINDEPGSREVTPATEAKTKLGIPHVAIFIGLQVK